MHILQKEQKKTNCKFKRENKNLSQTKIINDA